jgi:hypothetical protein
MQTKEPEPKTRREYAEQEHQASVEEKTAKLRHRLNLAILITVCLLVVVLLILFKL